MVSMEVVLKRWKEYFEKLMNEENDGEPKTEKTEVVNEEVNCISREEVKNALRRMKKGKAVGLDELPVEISKCMAVMRIKFSPAFLANACKKYFYADLKRERLNLVNFEVLIPKVTSDFFYHVKFFTKCNLKF